MTATGAYSTSQHNGFSTGRALTGLIVFDAEVNGIRENKFANNVIGESVVRRCTGMVVWWRCVEKGDERNHQ